MSLEELIVEHGSVKQSLANISQQISDLLTKQEELQERKSLLETEIEILQSSTSTAAASDLQWSSEEFSWSKELRLKLCNVFKMNDFRSKQLEVINATLSCHDVILIMATGGGKSLCYQLAALTSAGITLVISPLVSLMEDQVHHLTKRGITSEFLQADSSKETVKRVHQLMVSPTPACKLIYITPEKLSKSKRFLSQLEKCYKAGNLARIAIDEVHCVSQWGNDFRPDYKFLGILKRQFPQTPILGLTATSTSKVTMDTKKMLNIPRALVFKTPLNRSNLFYDVRMKPTNYEEAIYDMATTIKTSFKNQSGIVYCSSRKNCVDVSKSLSKLGIPSAGYHAYMPADAKTQVHHLWHHGRVQVICATVAFGMGIDKPDVRFVIHFSLSKSVENYYQESGRAGRDGEPALCLLYFGFGDIFRQSCMVMTERTGLENLSKMLEYSVDVTRCRRRLIAEYFGESWESINCDGMCDVCSKVRDYRSCDVTKECRSLLDLVRDAEATGDGHRLTGAKLVEAAGGRGKQKTRDDRLKKMSSTDAQNVIILLIIQKYLREDFHFTPYSTISYLVPGSSSFQPETIITLHQSTTNRSRDVYRKIFPSNFVNGEREAPNFAKSNKRKSSHTTGCSKSLRLSESIIIDDSD